MTIAIITSTIAGSSDFDSVTTSGIDTTGASLLVVAVGEDNSGITLGNLSDSKGNTWTALTEYGTGSNRRVRLFYVVNPTVGSGHTFTYSDAANSPAPSIGVVALSGTATSSPFDAQNGGNGPSTGSVTPSQDNEILIAALAFRPDGTQSIDSSFSIAQQIGQSGGHEGLAFATKIQTTAGAENPTWSTSTSYTFKAACIACFKAAAGGGTTQPPVAAWTRNTNKIVSCGVF